MLLIPIENISMSLYPHVFPASPRKLLPSYSIPRIGCFFAGWHRLTYVSSIAVRSRLSFLDNSYVNYIWNAIRVSIYPELMLWGTYPLHFFFIRSAFVSILWYVFRRIPYWDEKGIHAYSKESVIAGTRFFRLPCSIIVYSSVTFKISIFTFKSCVASLKTSVFSIFF